MKPLVSIIIPVYRSEKYLERCVDSVIAQNYPQLEIILVDDGSPDDCPQICDKYASIDSRIKVIHQPNAGASAARNSGLNIASGKYVCFVDSDDILPESAISDLWQGITDNGCQYAAGICGILNSSKIKNTISAVSVFMEIRSKSWLIS